VPLVTITSYEMMQRLTCDACKGRGGPHVSMCAGKRPPCRDPQNCMASLRWKVVVVDGEWAGWCNWMGGWVAGVLGSGTSVGGLPLIEVDMRTVRLCVSNHLSVSHQHFLLPLNPNVAPPVPESHTLRTSCKPPDALHTEAVVSAVKAARRAILLTGTPSLSRPFDLFRQVGGSKFEQARRANGG